MTSHPSVPILIDVEDAWIRVVMSRSSVGNLMKRRVAAARADDVPDLGRSG
jgi:hypothetical protein